MKKILLIVSIFCSLNLSAKENILFQDSSFVFPYDLENPEIKMTLPKVLVEISGLTFIDKSTLAAVQDEKGKIFLLDSKTGRIKDDIDIDKDGDYEGVEIVDDNIWMIKSNGNLYRIKNYDSKKFEVDEYKTDLSSKNNSEGLGYDPLTGKLLIACKGHPYLDKNKNGKHLKNIYAFDPVKKKLKDVVLSIQLDSLKKHLNHNTLAKVGLKLLSFLDSSSGDLTFQPSGIAVHPKTKNFYVLSSIGKRLLVYNRDNELMAMTKLKKGLFPQAEGICFDDEGNLFISNEGKDKKGTILKFNMTN